MEINDYLISSIFRFKNVAKSLRTKLNSCLAGYDIGIAELTLMRAIVDNALDSDANVNISDIQGYLFVTKGAVSQMLGSLEKKGYISRDINKKNRRKLIITLTPTGEELLIKLDGKLEKLLSAVIVQVGTDNAMQAISVINNFADAVEQLENEGDGNALETIMERN